MLTVDKTFDKNLDNTELYTIVSSELGIMYHNDRKNEFKPIEIRSNLYGAKTICDIVHKKKVKKSNRKKNKCSKQSRKNNRK